VLKDNDLNFKVTLGSSGGGGGGGRRTRGRREVEEQLIRDAECLACCGIMDYSLLLGVFYEEFELKGRRKIGGSAGLATVDEEEGKEEKIHDDVEEGGAGMGNCGSRLEAGRVLGPSTFYIGIIDILQEWNLKKQGERFWKVHVRGADPEGLSAMEPMAYYERFREKIHDILSVDDED